MTNHPNPWTAEDDERLRALWESHAEVDEIAELLDRSDNAVFARVAALRLPRRSGPIPWTRAEMDRLRNLFERGLSDMEIAAAFEGRSLSAVVRQRGKLGLHRRHPRDLALRPAPVVGPAKTCQWIEGDHPAGTLPPICGRPSAEGKSYCPEHLRRAYRQPGDPPLARKRHREPLRAAGRG